MALSWLERKGVQFAWGRVQKAWPVVRRWAPLIGTAGLAASTIARALGLTELADLLDAVTGTTGLDEQSPVSRGELVFVMASVMGIYLKLSARKKAILAEAYLEGRPEAAKAAATKEVLSVSPVALAPPATEPPPEDVQAVHDVLRAGEELPAPKHKRKGR